MMEDDSIEISDIPDIEIPDIETPADEVVQQQEPRAKTSKKAIKISAGVALVVVVAIGVAIGTRMRDEGGSVDVQAAFLTTGENNTLFPTTTPLLKPGECGFTLESNFSSLPCSVEGEMCTIGEESCCGKTFNSIECVCEVGAWGCYHTDACMAPDCEEPTTEPVAPPSSCDYTVSNKFCDTNDDCTCGNVCLDSPFDDFSVCGCEVGTTNGCDPASNKPLCYKGYTPSGVGCGCRDDTDCEGDQTCGTSWCVANIIPFCSADHNAECPPTQSPGSSSTATSAPTANTTVGDPTPGPSVDPGKVNPAPSPEPTAAVTTVSTSVAGGTKSPTSVVVGTKSPTSDAVGSTSPTSVGSPTTLAPTGVAVPPPTPQSSTSYCVNIKFTTGLNYPKDNGFKFLSKETGEVLYEQEVGSMPDPQTPYLTEICELPAGNYQLVVTDAGGDGLYVDGKGSFVVDIDGTVILVGGRFRGPEITHDIIVGFDANMSEKDKAFLDAHNSKRKTFHENQGVVYRPLAWSADLAAGASAWAKERAKTCTESPKGSGRFGQNIASQKLVKPEAERAPGTVVSWWTNNFNPSQVEWGTNLQPGSAVYWRAALYVGCASEVAPIDNCDPTLTPACFCQIINCRYARTTNCGTTANSINWLNKTLDDNTDLCGGVFCPGADANGTIVEGPCHA